MNKLIDQKYCILECYQKLNDCEIEAVNERLYAVKWCRTNNYNPLSWHKCIDLQINGVEKHTKCKNDAIICLNKCRELQDN